MLIHRMVGKFSPAEYKKERVAVSFTGDEADLILVNFKEFLELASTDPEHNKLL